MLRYFFRYMMFRFLMKFVWRIVAVGFVAAVPFWADIQHKYDSFFNFDPPAKHRSVSGSRS